MKISSLDQADQVLERYIPLSKEITGKDITLERMYVLLERCGNPHQKLKVVHVAGTSGKTSTSYYITDLLHRAGGKIGLTVSPHIDTVAERVQIDGAPLGEELFCEYLGEFIDIIDGIEPTYFELLIAFAYWVFDKEQVDYAVMETGLGGLQDSTNTASREDKVCVITDIGFDHMHVLGNTISEIASQKAGIIHEHNQVFLYAQEQDVMSAISRRADLKQAVVSTLEQGELSHKFADMPPGLPLFQKRNWLLARQVVEFIIKRDGLTALTEAEELESQSLRVPGRMDIEIVDGKTLIMDGAHNQQKMQALIRSFKDIYKNQKVPVLLSMKNGKEYQDVIDELSTVASEIIVTTFALNQDLRTHSIDAAVLEDYCRQKGIKNVRRIDDLPAAYRALLECPGDVLLVTGSFYLISKLRSLNLQA